jgi:flagellar basal body P-ring formation protein FlgA
MKSHLLIVWCSAVLALSASGATATTSVDPTANSITPLTRDALLADLSRDLATHFEIDGDLTLELLRTWAPPAQVATVWHVEILDYPSVLSSAMMVRCRVTADNNVVAEPTFMVKASLWRDVWATRLPLTTGAIFDPSVLEVRRVDALREREAVRTSVGDRNYVFSRAIPAGRLLTWNDIAHRPLVKKGEMVEVSAVEGMLTVTMKALAMESGSRGDTVTVRNPDSRKDFAALVVDENRVQVRF